MPMNPVIRGLLAYACLLACAACSVLSGLNQLGESECTNPCSGPGVIRDDASAADGPIIQGARAIDIAQHDASVATDSMVLTTSATANDSSSSDNDAANEAGADASVTADAGADPEAGAKADASAVADAGANADASDATPVDAPSGVASGPFCTKLSPRPLFCEDFDEHALPGPWSTFHQVGGTLSIDNTTFVSAPNSLFARYGAMPMGAELDDVLRAAFSLQNAPATTALELQVRPTIADPTPNAAVVIAAVDFLDAANDRYSVQFTLVNKGGVLNVLFEEQSGFAGGGTSYVPHAITDPMPLGQWTDLRLTIVASSATSAEAHVFFGTTHEIDVPLNVTVRATKVQLDVGSTYESQPSMGWGVFYDNVAFDTK
jgi:hypothetical protein